MGSKGRLVAAIALSAVSISVAACSSSGSTSSSTTGNGAAPVTTGGNGSPSETGGSTAMNPGTIVAADVDLDTLLPANTQLAFSEVGLLWAPIVTFNADGSLRYIQASSVVGSKNSTVWTIKFRPGWTFHNGEPVTAQSYADGWNFAAYGPNGNSDGYQLANVVGYSDLNPQSGKPKVKTLSGLKVLDKYTLQVTLSKPDSQFPLELGPGQPGLYPMPKAGIQNPSSFKLDPIGDGPYEMDGAASLNQYVKLKAYPGYTGPNKPHVEHIEFKLYSSPDTAWTDTQAGNVDIDLAPQDKFLQIKSDFGDRVVLASGASIEWLGFPLFDKRFQNIKLREAISLAIDRDAINKAIFGGIYQPADSLFAPAMIGGSTHACKWCHFDPTEAKKLLQEAGGWSGPMVIPYPGGAGYDQAFQAVANQIRQNLGIDCTAKPSVGFSDFFANLEKRKYTDGPFRGKWGSTYPSPADTLNSLFTPTSPYNDSVGYYTNPKVTSYIQQGNAAPNLQAAVKYYQDAERTIESDFPVIPMFWEKFAFVYSDRVTNVHTQPGLIDIDWTDLELK